MIDPLANQAAMQALADEIRQLSLKLAASQGNLALYQKEIEKLEKEVADLRAQLAEHDPEPVDEHAGNS